MRAFDAALAEEHNIKLRQDMKEGQRSEASPAVSGELLPGEARQSFSRGMRRLSRPCVLGLILAACAYGAAGRLWMGYAVDHGMETWARCFRFTVPDRSHAYGCRLIEAADSSRMAQLRALLAAGADVNARCDGFTPLDAAAWSGNAEAVRLLLAAGADVNAKNGLGWTALHEAVRLGHPDVAELLRAHGAEE